MKKRSESKVLNNSHRGSWLSRSGRRWVGGTRRHGSRGLRLPDGYPGREGPGARALFSGWEERALTGTPAGPPHRVFRTSSRHCTHAFTHTLSLTYTLTYRDINIRTSTRQSNFLCFVVFEKIMAHW